MKSEIRPGMSDEEIKELIIKSFQKKLAGHEKTIITEVLIDTFANGFILGYRNRGNTKVIIMDNTTRIGQGG